MANKFVKRIAAVGLTIALAAFGGATLAGCGNNQEDAAKDPTLQQLLENRDKARAEYDKAQKAVDQAAKDLEAGNNDYAEKEKAWTERNLELQRQNKDLKEQNAALQKENEGARKALAQLEKTQEVRDALSDFEDYVLYDASSLRDIAGTFQDAKEISRSVSELNSDGAISMETANTILNGVNAALKSYTTSVAYNAAENAYDRGTKEVLSVSGGDRVRSYSSTTCVNGGRLASVVTGSDPLDITATKIENGVSQSGNLLTGDYKEESKEVTKSGWTKEFTDMVETSLEKGTVDYQAGKGIVINTTTKVDGQSCDKELSFNVENGCLTNYTIEITPTNSEDKEAETAVITADYTECDELTYEEQAKKVDTVLARLDKDAGKEQD